MCSDSTTTCPPANISSPHRDLCTPGFKNPVCVLTPNHLSSPHAIRLRPNPPPPHPRGSFSLSIQPGELPRLPQILTNVEPFQLQNMQRRISRVWQRLAWLDHPLVLAQAAEVMRTNLEKYKWIDKEQRRMEKLVQQGKMTDTIFPNGIRLMRRADAEDDAFNTVMQWLHHKAQQLHGQTKWLSGGPGPQKGEVQQHRAKQQVRRRRRRVVSSGGTEGGAVRDQQVRRKHKRAARGVQAPLPLPVQQQQQHP